MRHFIAASIVATAAFASVEAQASHESTFKAVCEATLNNTPLASAKDKAAVLAVQGIIKAVDQTNCNLAWQRAEKLTSLDLSGKEITDATIVAGLPMLTELNLSGNAITDLAPLAGLKELTKLDVSENKLTDISFVAGMTKMTELNIAKNEIADISALGEMSMLTELRANDNKIDKVFVLSGLKSLKKVFLSSNQIDNLAPLAKNKKLAELAVRNNPVKNCPDGNKVEVKGKEIENTDLLKGICKDEAYKKGN